MLGDAGPPGQRQTRTNVLVFQAKGVRVREVAAVVRSRAERNVLARAYPGLILQRLLRSVLTHGRVVPPAGEPCESSVAHTRC